MIKVRIGESQGTAKLESNCFEPIRTGKELVINDKSASKKEEVDSLEENISKDRK